MMETKCYRCGGNRLESGILKSTGQVHFKPDDTKMMSFLTSDVGVKAQMCPDCGAVELVGDKEKLAGLVHHETNS